MERDTLARLLAARREMRPMVRAIDLESSEERLIDPANDSSQLGLAAAAALRADKSTSIVLEGRNWFLTVYNVPWEIVIVGAVHIAQSLAALALTSGYRVRVIDPRAIYATEERFPGIALVRAWPDEALAAQPLTARSALVALAHDPKLDDAALIAALRQPADYIGALGSARTHARRLARLRERNFSSQELERIHGPVGLAIGARAPAEIAIAILAELVEIRHARPRVAGLVLAAGTSSRMGRNKLTAPLTGKPMLRHAVEAALASRLEWVTVVTGHDAAAVESVLKGMPVRFVHNPDYKAGLSTSLRAGVAAQAPGCDGVLVLLGDMPAITSGLIDRSIAAFSPAAGRAICVATVCGQYGHPVLWGRQFFEEIEQMTGDKGGRGLIDAHSDLVCEIEAEDSGPLTDIDTPEALAAYCA
jgi:CTP:molybdopterin cytidylyltransferase MocA/xanthine/CO dehydrogenase XdhC/CoxF family maturation factor